MLIEYVEDVLNNQERRQESIGNQILSCLLNLALGIWIVVDVIIRRLHLHFVQRESNIGVLL